MRAYPLNKLTGSELAWLPFTKFKTLRNLPLSLYDEFDWENECGENLYYTLHGIDGLDDNEDSIVINIIKKDGQYFITRENYRMINYSGSVNHDKY